MTARTRCTFDVTTSEFDNSGTVSITERAQHTKRGCRCKSSSTTRRTLYLRFHMSSRNVATIRTLELERVNKQSTIQRREIAAQTDKFARGSNPWARIVTARTRCTFGVTTSEFDNSGTVSITERAQHTKQGCRCKSSSTARRTLYLGFHMASRNVATMGMLELERVNK